MPARLERQRIWDRSHSGKPISEGPESSVIAFASYIQKRLPPRASLLDAGCGRGRHLFYLSRSGFTVHGCDISPAALEVVRSRAAGPPVYLLVCDLTCLPYADNSFAAALCIHTLPYHLKTDITRGICELRRVIRPGGWLSVDFLDRDDADYGCGRELEQDTFLDPDGAPVHFSSWGEIHGLLNGFTLERALRRETKSSPARTRVTWTLWAVKCAGERRALQP